MKLPIFLTTSFFLFFLPHFIAAKSVSTKFHFTDYYCRRTAGNYSTNSPFENNFNDLVVDLVEQASFVGFSSKSKGDGIDEVYMLFNCRGDLDRNDCQNCIKEAAVSIVQKCPTAKDAMVFYEQCMLRYANRNIQSLEEEFPFTWEAWGKVSNPQEFGPVLAETIDGLIKQAAYNKTTQGYAIGITDTTGIESFDEVYSFVQCTPDILGKWCERCLREAFAAMGGCCGTGRHMIHFYFPSCQIRYDPSPFINGTSVQRPNTTSRSDESLQPPPPSGTATQLDGGMFIFGIVLAVSMLLITTEPTSN